jgi:multidrug resistance protein, MATE family
MTSLDEIERGSILAPDTVAASGQELAVELTETLRLAVPIALTQLGQIAMMTTDLVLIGRLGDESVAAAALAHTVFFISFTFGMGLVSAVAPLAAQAFGARNPRLVRRALRVGLWAALAISLPMMVLPLFGERILLTLGQAPAIADLAQRYLFGLAWGITPALWFLAIRGFMGAVNRPEPGLWITLAAIPANAVLGYLLIYGELGLPRLGLLGAGLATTTINSAMFLAGLWFVTERRPFRKYHVLGRIWRIDWTLMRQLIVIGVPISISFLLEYGLFAAAGLLMGLISTTALAAHQICAADRGHFVHGTVRRRDGGDRACRSRRRAWRWTGRQARGLGRDQPRHCLYVRHDPRRDSRAICDRAIFLRRGDRERRRRHRPHRDTSHDRRDVLCR